MSVPHVDTDLYMDTPLNALTKSSDIIERQLQSLGISLDGDDPVSADDATNQTMQALSTQPTTVTSPMDVFRGEGNTQLPEFETMAPTTAPSESTPAAQSAPTMVMNGPAPTGESLGDVAESYGVPTSIKTILDDAQEAFVGIMSDLTRSRDEKLSYQDIFGREDRLRGLGSLFIVIGVIGVVLGGLTS